ncbi:GNAT family N-acetyltransferase [Pseudonocardia sp. GCM10023141]|uniref:GNAT family N-acetyltransferase n=1 Tax=Pseudonocardia sp. GCM10023141 TaxID=3252653 RepID=UPI0036236870
MDDVLERIDRFCDTVPRAWASATDIGPLRLFTRNGKGWPFYARPVPGGGPITMADVQRVRERQRELGVSEAFEWVYAVAPSMADAAEAAGLEALVCPIMVLDGIPKSPDLPRGYTARLLGPADGDLGAAVHTLNSVAAAAFGAPPPGAPTEADLTVLRTDLAEGRLAKALICGPNGAVAAGSAQRSGDVVEVAGIGTAIAERGIGLGGAITALLAGAATRAGAELTFLSAGSDAATRVYQRVGFRKVGECAVAEPAAS